MGLREALGLAGSGSLQIDWDLTPADTFAIFESWGGRFRVRGREERYYYFYIDAWQEPPRLLLMERGVKHARRLARIKAPQSLINACVAGQGRDALDKNYAVDQTLRQWLTANLLGPEDLSLLEILEREAEEEMAASGLPDRQAPRPAVEVVRLRREPAVLGEEQVAACLRQGNFFDSRLHPEGRFENLLVDNGDRLTVTDLRTGLVWQRGGCDITTIRNLRRQVEALNRERWGGAGDWRLPTLEEACSLLEPVANPEGLHLHPCFSRQQPFVFLADERSPGGYWFVDFKQATVFWASGTIPGGFGRLCRSVE